MTGQEPRRHDRGMDLTASLAWLLDEAGAAPGPDRFLAELGVRLLADGLPLAGGALTLAVPHPIIARRTWLWRAETGAVIEALGFAGGPPNQAGRDWLAGLGPVQEDAIGPSLNSPRQDSPRADSPVLGWAGTRWFSPAETGRLRQAARFAAAPIAALAGRAALSALLEAYLGRRSAARVQAGAARRGTGETIRAALLSADLRDFTALSEATEPAAVIAALDAWFDRIAGAVHAFGGEVLKFIGDGVLAAAALRRGAASRRDTVGQYRRRRPAGLHRDRPRGQPGQPAGGAVPAARPVGANLGRGRCRNHRAAGAAGRTHAARHRRTLRRLHLARCVSGSANRRWASVRAFLRRGRPARAAIPRRIDALDRLPNTTRLAKSTQRRRCSRHRCSGPDMDQEGENQ